MDGTRKAIVLSTRKRNYRFTIVISEGCARSRDSELACQYKAFTMSTLSKTGFATENCSVVRRRRVAWWDARCASPNFLHKDRVSPVSRHARFDA